MNIWTSENIMKYWDGTSTTARGEWTKRNGENAIAIQPNNFYENAAYIKIFKDELLPNVRYVVCLHIDSDDVVYNGTNVGGGVILHYTDGTQIYLSPTGSKTSPKGWQSYYHVTDPSKSLDHISSYYYTSVPVYYRWDSFIIPYNELQVQQQGIANINNLQNNYVKIDPASVREGGVIYSNNFYEF